MQLEKEIQERIEAKTRDSLLYETLVSQFEFSPKTADAVIGTVRDIYELHRFNPDQMCPTGQVIRQVISLKPNFPVKL